MLRAMIHRTAWFLALALTACAVSEEQTVDGGGVPVGGVSDTARGSSDAPGEDAASTAQDAASADADATESGPDGSLGEDASGDAAAPDVVADSGGGPDGAPVDAPAPDDTADAGAPDAGPPVPTTIGGDRPAVVHVPDGFHAGGPWPLVILLHGYSVNGFIQDTYLGVSQRVTEDGFVLLVPNGTKDEAGDQFWNATEYCCDFYGSGVDDVAYIDGLIDEAVATLSVDPARVYLMGHSNGGFMSYRMACESGDRIAGIVSIAGSTFADEADCAGTDPVAVLQVHGTLDADVAYTGSGYPGAEETVARWAARDGCPAQGEAAGTADYDQAVAGAETSVTRFAPCSAGTAVELWTLTGSGHIPAFDPSFTKAALAFLLAHHK